MTETTTAEVSEEQVVLPEVPPSVETMDYKARVDFVQLCRIAMQQGQTVPDAHLLVAVECLQKIRSTSSSAGKKEGKAASSKPAPMTLDDL